METDSLRINFARHYREEHLSITENIPRTFMLLSQLALLGDINWNYVLIGAGLFVGMALLSIAIVVAILIRVPEDYFVNGDDGGNSSTRRPVRYWLLRIGKNVLGFGLIVLGIVLSFLPGQGLLTILIGVMLVEFPGKRRLEKWIIGRPKVFGAINRLRARWNKPPLKPPRQSARR